MPVVNRGKILNRDRARQIKDFTGLRFGNITPTDIDGMIEYHDKGYIFIELKLGDTPILFGQRLALERLTDDLSRASKPTICIIAKHNSVNNDEDIDVANAVVSEYRLNGIWHIPQLIFTVRHLIDMHLNKSFGRIIEGSG